MLIGEHAVDEAALLGVELVFAALGRERLLRKGSQGLGDALALDGARGLEAVRVGAMALLLVMRAVMVLVRMTPAGDEPVHGLITDN